ncbi:MAG: hypothetical protein NC299_15350 [Lachnospiraceae bacterium]|nr:hypothetical protein [Ruminococcus sp.]MCM1276710.1 hypothetical protein [Lachnospiraceae bacterium]
MNNKKQQQNNQSTRQLLGIESITEYSLKTASNEAVFFSIKPSNISVMSEAGLAAKIYSLMSVLKGLTEIEILCVNSRESFEGNQNHLRSLAKREENPAVRKLLEQDMQHLDHIQAMTATAREFLLIVRIRGLKDKEIFSYLNRIEKTLNENGFSARRYNGEDIKTLLAVYFEQNVTTENFENFDGER